MPRLGTGSLVRNVRDTPMCLYDNALRVGVDRTEIGNFDVRAVGLVVVQDGEWVLVMCDDKLGWIRACHVEDVG